MKLNQQQLSNVGLVLSVLSVGITLINGQINKRITDMSINDKVNAAVDKIVKERMGN